MGLAGQIINWPAGTKAKYSTVSAERQGWHELFRNGIRGFSASRTSGLTQKAFFRHNCQKTTYFLVQMLYNRNVIGMGTHRLN